MIARPSEGLLAGDDVRAGRFVQDGHADTLRRLSFAEIAVSKTPGGFLPVFPVFASVTL